uniref:Ammonium transporter n=1 Tax=Tridacna squamosa TaxID=80830 RepID=A0A2S0DGU7_TRISQ|nr:ammonium transporter 1 [Tridacna squamosa]
MAIGTELDQFFLIIMGMVVLFMQCGFAFLEAGAVRSKNVTNILIKNVFDSFVSGVAYWLFGYAFAFGDGNDFIGYKFFASSDLPDTSYASFFFQYTFAATAATIVSGAVAERCEFVAYFVYSFFITGFIYPVVTHWQWGGGFLFKGKDYDDIGNVAYVDFAGSGLVHVLGGTAAFIGAVLLGPRIGRFHKQTNTAIPIRGHSIPIAALGGFILFFGFLAFNGGSQTQIANDGDGAVVSLAVVNTVISGSFAAFSSLLINRIHLFGTARWSLLITINGALTGMVAACAGCDSMYPWGACILGCVSGIVFHIYSALLRKLHVDDPLDAVAVHFGGGSWGVIAIAFLHKDIGILMEHNRKSGLFLAWQLAGLAVITGWTAVLCLILFGLLKITKLLRVPQEIELKGLDIPKHNEPAYPVEAYGHGHIEKILQIMESNPTYVTQLFKRLSQSGQHGEHTNPAFQAHLEDVGPYESPEVNAINRANGKGVTLVKPNTSANNGDTAVYIPADRL